MSVGPLSEPPRADSAHRSRRERVRDLPPPREGVVKPARIDPRGVAGPTRAQARGLGWRRTTRGLYVPAGFERTLDQRIYEAAMLVPHYGGLTGWASLAWAGARWFNGLAPDGETELPVTIVGKHHEVLAQPGVAVTSEWIPQGHLTTVSGLPSVSLVHAVCFAARYARDVRAAVTVIEMAAYDDLVSLEEVAEHIPWLASRVGVPQLRAAYALSCESSWSPQEVAMRLVWELDLAFSAPLCNHPVFDLSGRHVGTPDLIDVQAGVVGQYDGATHFTAKLRSVDLGKEDAYRRLGLECFTLVSDDIRNPARAEQRMRETRARALWEPADRRRWTVDPPSWWTPTATVAQRRALTGRQRERLLRYRAA